MDPAFQLKLESVVQQQSQPKQIIHEQPNGQFQIIENGALNLMKADSISMLVVNNLAQDLSIGKNSFDCKQSFNDTQEMDMEKPSNDCMISVSNSIQFNPRDNEVSRMPCNSTDVETSNDELPSFLSSLVDNAAVISCESTDSAMSPQKMNVLDSDLDACSNAGLVTLSPNESYEKDDIQQDIVLSSTTDSNSIGGIFPEITSNSLINENICRWKGCSSRFLQQEELINHVNEQHIKCEDDEEYKCQWINCSRKGRGFNARYKMLIHVRTHTQEKPHRCTVCLKSFSRLENLKIHTRTHTGEKPYMCPVEGCKKAYGNSSDRFKHVRTHQEGKPFLCKMPGCGKRYTDPSSLRKHIKNYGHKVVPGSDTSKSKNKSNGSGVALLELDMTCSKTSVQPSNDTTNTVVTIMPKDVSTAQVISIKGSMVQISSLSSNPLLSSAVMQSSNVKQLKAEEICCNSTSLESSVCKDGFDLLKDDLLANAKEALCLEKETNFLATYDEGKAQDGPLDLSTCTGLAASMADDGLHLSLSTLSNHSGS